MGSKHLVVASKSLEEVPNPAQDRFVHDRIYDSSSTKLTNLNESWIVSFDNYPDDEIGDSFENVSHPDCILPGGHRLTLSLLFSKSTRRAVIVWSPPCMSLVGFSRRFRGGVARG
jgi:hypothetical protein